MSSMKVVNRLYVSSVIPHLDVLDTHTTFLKISVQCWPKGYL